jgi:hypothetical protein
MNSFVTIVIISLMIVAALTTTSAAAAAYKQGKSEINTSVCKDNKPCNNIAVVCPGDQLCTRTQWNSTDANDLIAETE